MSTSYRSVKRALRQTGRKLSAGLLTVAATAAVVPFKVERTEIPETGDDGIVLTSLLFRASYSPAREDSERTESTFTVSLRPSKEIGNSLARLAVAAVPKKPVEPAALKEDEIFDEDEKVQKETAKVRTLEEKAEKHRVKIAKRRRKLAKQRARRARK